MIPADSIASALCFMDLQVQLCEWRKFRTAVDKKRTAARGALLGQGSGEGGADAPSLQAGRKRRLS